MIHATITADPGTATRSRRREERVEAGAGVSLRPLGTTAVEAQLINISSLGFMAETDAQIEAGSRVWLTLPGAERVNALVIWARSGRLGGEFATPIDPLEVLQAIGTQG
jgi:hypothetical protein